MFIHTYICNDEKFTISLYERDRVYTVLQINITSILETLLIMNIINYWYFLLFGFNNLIIYI